MEVENPQPESGPTVGVGQATDTENQQQQVPSPDPVPTEGDFPAVAEVPSDSTEERYIVTGTAAVFGYNPGQTFTATFDRETKEYYLNGGHLAVVPDVDTQTKGETVPVEGDQTTEEQKTGE